jgi:AAA domain (dynein-related subfamily)
MPLPLCGDTRYQAQLEKFLARWPLAKLRTMTLADYATYGSKDCFIYWFEQVAPGDVGGFPLKSGIYGRDPSIEKSSDDITRYDDTYAWSAKLGNSPEESFAKVKGCLIAIVEGSLNNELPPMTDLPVSPTVAWKIAFSYQDPAKPVATACFKEDSLRAYCKRFSLGEPGDTPAALHHAAIARSNNSNLPINLFELGGVIWRIGSFKGNIWNYSYERGDAEGINDIAALLQTSEIKGRWETGGTLASLPNEKEAGKAAAVALLGHDEIEEEDGAEDEVAGFDFSEMKIPQGAKLTYAADGQKVAEVVDARRVSYQGETVSLYELTQRLKGTRGVPWGSWEYQGVKLSKHYKEAYPTSKPTQAALMCWWFAKKMQLGDLVFARKSRSQDYIVGVVKSDYFFELSRPNYQHVRKVEWLRREPKSVPEVRSIHAKALTDISDWPDSVTLLFRALNFEMPNLTNTKAPPPDNAKRKPTNVIFYGPPGTGKTYKTKEHAIRTCLGKDNYVKDQAEGDFKRLLATGQIEFTTFHQSYDYADFIIGFKPETVGDAMVFKPKPGLLLRIAQRARDNPTQEYLLIMDEVNRGNISKIFGELITLIEPDKRAEGDFPLSVTLPCACPGYLAGDNHDQFSLPSNVHFLGTMNTADRSIALLDTALRRRFRFKEMVPDPTLLPTNLSGINLRMLLEKLNLALRAKLTRDHQIGHAWLPMVTAKYTSLNPAPDAEAIAQEINEKIMPLIDEWFYENLDDKKVALKGLAKPSADDAAKYIVTATTLKDYTGA